MDFYRTPWAMDFYRTELRSHGWDFVRPSGRNLVWKVREVRNEPGGYCHYRVTWVASAPTVRTEQDVMGNGTGFLDTLKQGDRVALWASRSEVIARS